MTPDIFAGRGNCGPDMKQPRCWNTGARSLWKGKSRMCEKRTTSAPEGATSTTTATVDITCPHWCMMEPQHHADDLWTQGGTVVHHMKDIVLRDDEGFEQMAGEDPLPCEPFELSVSTVTRPDGTTAAAPCIYINQREATIKQAEEVAAALLEVIALAKEALR